MNNFIVYTFTIPGDSLPFYVGKGRSNRPQQHFRKQSLIETTHFYNKLRNLLLKSIYPEIKVLASNLTERQAFDLEINLIRIYGRQDKGTGCLTNHTDGGDGQTGSSWNRGRVQSIEERLAHCVPRTKQGKENIRKGKRQQAGTPIESFNLRTCEVIKKYECQADVKLDGYSQPAVNHVLRGIAKSSQGLGWRYSLQVKHG